MKKIKNYLTSWNKFEQYCINKAKGHCQLNNNAWRKLREYHLEGYLNKDDNPFGLLFTIKTFNRELYHSVNCMAKLYDKYARQRTAEFKDDAMTRYKKIVRHKQKEKVTPPNASRLLVTKSCAAAGASERTEDRSDSIGSRWAR